MNRLNTHPALDDLIARARRRIPHFAWEYLDSGTGPEQGVRRNRDGLDAVCLRPAAMTGVVSPRTATTFLGRDYAAPFGIAPLGLSGLIWPGAEFLLARHAASARIPYGLSTVASRLPEEIAPISGDMGWFQLYAPTDPTVRKDIVARVAKAGFDALVLTVDVPALSRRERQRRAELTVPPKTTPRMLAAVSTCPAWALGTLRYGKPRLRLMEQYAPAGGVSTSRADHAVRTNPDWDYLAALREDWKGKLIVKGVMEPDIAKRLKAEGVDAVWVSNHSARQFDASPSSISVLPEVRKAVGKTYPLIFDSGVRSGLDVARAIACGADFVMLGRAWHYALGAFGAEGPAHMHAILDEDLKVNMAQIGAQRLADIAGRLC